MNDFCRAVLDLIAAGILGKNTHIPENFDWKQALTLCESHSVTSMLCCGVQNLNICIPSDVKNSYIRAVYGCMVIDELQRHEISLLSDAFKKNNIDHMPLKGILMKKLYPSTEMRTMVDADILIREEQYDKISDILKSLGYSEINRSDHEYIWNKDVSLNLELHSKLIPSYNKDYYKYFGDGWKFADKTDTSEYKMKIEDEFVYVFTHFAKHYRDAGAGIRNMTDLFVYLNSNQEIDMVYVEKAIESLGLSAFYENIMRTLKVWFEDGEPDEKTEFITTKIFNEGLHGTFYNHVLSGAIRHEKQEKSALTRAELIKDYLFPSFKDMKAKYHNLEKMPYMMPVYWLKRILVALVYKKENVQMCKHTAKILSKKNVRKYHEELMYVGLDFDF